MKECRVVLFAATRASVRSLWCLKELKLALQWGKETIAVILDENTSGDASRYEAAKGYFTAIRDAGGLPFGIPYLPEIVDAAVDDFDGLLCAGGRFAYPEGWYVDGASKAPASERFEVERGIVEKYLERDKPILGI